MIETAAMVRQRFLAADHCYYFSKRDFPEWHQGRRYYYVWALLLDHSDVRARMAAVQDALAPFLVAPYQRQAHISLHVPGFINDRHGDVLQQQAAAIKSLMQAPFSIDVGAANSFLLSPILDVDDKQLILHKLRKQLQLHGDEDREERFYPHVTVGLYGQKTAVKKLARHLQSLPVCSSLVVNITAIQLCRYKSNDIGSMLEVCESIPFN